ncbi:hypothetical protein LCGC14_1519380 [marine sediment metagenome]|uniref:Uncharacterized protein n=1 Tax=marine sediment metagenome TaxID=412755 RepID=A0A0F9LEP4_9ZZZZ
MRDEVLIDTIKGFIAIGEQNLKRAEELYRLLGMGIAGVKESLAEDKKRLNALISKDRNT